MEVSYQEMQNIEGVEAKKLIEAYERVKSIAKTAKLLGTSPSVVRKWM